jgi:O-antigen/teichoic acid export membrane protein
LGLNTGGKLPNVERAISYISIGIVLFVGVLVIVGYFGFMEPIYRMVFGLVIVAYAGVRLVMLQSARQRESKKS